MGSSNRGGVVFSPAAKWDVQLYSYKWLLEAI